MATMTTQGETLTTTISTYDYSLFTDKIKHLNKQLAKYGLGSAQVLHREMRQIPLSEITGNRDDEGVVSRWFITIEVPVASMKIDGYTFLGVVEDLGKGQRLLSGVVTDRSSLPTDPYPEHDYNSDERDPHATERRLWWETVYVPAFVALKEANVLKMSPVRHEPMHCVHCQTTRARKQTFAFEKADGQIVQVGTQCAKEYFGIDLAGVLQGTWDLQERCGGTPSSFSATRYHKDLFLALYLLKHYGYVSNKVEQSYQDQAQFVPANTPLHVRCSSRTLGQDMGHALDMLWNPELMSATEWDALAADTAKSLVDLTAEAAQVGNEILAAEEAGDRFHTELSDRRSAIARKIEFVGALIRTAGNDDVTTWKAENYALHFASEMVHEADAYREAFTQITNYWANLEVADTDQFNQNVKAVALAEANKSFAMTAMVVFGWMKATTDMPRAAFFVPAHRRQFPAQPVDAFLAPEGTMINVEFTVTMKRSGGDDYNPWFKIVGRTAENLEVSLFCKRDMFSVAREGEQMKLRAKVKAHSRYMNRPATELFYAKVVD